MKAIRPGVQLSSSEVHILTKVIDLAERTALSLEADKNIEEEAGAIEVRLLKALEELDVDYGITIASLRQAVELPPLIKED